MSNENNSFPVSIASVFMIACFFIGYYAGGQQDDFMIKNQEKAIARLKSDKDQLNEKIRKIEKEIPLKKVTIKDLRSLVDSLEIYIVE